MLPYVETLYVSGTSPADQEKILNSSTASSLVSPCHGHLPAAPFPSYPWFPMSPFAFDQGLVFPIDEEAALIVEEELNASPDVTLPSDPPPADYMVDVNTTLAGATGTAMAAALAAPQAADAAAAAFPEDKRNSVKKRFRTDRHSKIHTSQGLRDRRMRLSLDVARQFFDLQDILGFDKASQTISWLLTQSKVAIEQLTATRSSPGATGQAFNSPHSSFGSNDSSSDGEAVSPNPKPPSGGLLPLDAVALEAKSAKESRNKARARARQRTMEKNRKRIGCKSLLGDASAMDYQLVAPSKTSTVAAAGASAAAATADHNFEQPATWNGMTEHNPITTIPSEYLWSNHEAVSFMEEELKITESGNKHEDMVISWLM